MFPQELRALLLTAPLADVRQRLRLLEKNVLALVAQTARLSRLRDGGPNDPLLGAKVDLLNLPTADQTALNGLEKHVATSEKVAWVHG